MRCSWLAWFILFVATVLPARADEACRRNPDPVCIIDWVAPESPVERVRIRLQFDRVEDARRIGWTPPPELAKELEFLELTARTGQAQAGHAALRKWREDRDALFAGKDEDTLRNQLPNYINLIDVQRRAGDVAGARDTAKRAAVHALALHRMAPDLSALVAAFLGQIGRKQFRAGDREGAAASLAEAERLAPLADRDLASLDNASGRMLTNHLTHREIAQLRVLLGDPLPMQRSLASLADKAATMLSRVKDRDAVDLIDILTCVSALQTRLGDRDAASRVLQQARVLVNRLAADGIKRSDLDARLWMALTALGDWAAAHAIIDTLDVDLDRSVYAQMLAAEQAQSGDLRKAVETAHRALAHSVPDILLGLARAAGEER